MVMLRELVSYANEYLQVERFRDYAPNGLQVEGRAEVKKIISGVSACEALLRKARERSADLVLVHHGYFWKGEDPRLVGIKRKRLGLLIDNDISLLAYHLPLDAHPEIGNNRCLAERLELSIEGEFGLSEPKIGLFGELPSELSAGQFAQVIGNALGRDPLHCPGGPRKIKRVAVCSGGAQDYFQAAADEDVDAFVTGEVSERNWHEAAELGVHFFSAGHSATEMDGIQRLGDHLAAKFELNHEFIEIENPV